MMTLASLKAVTFILSIVLPGDDLRIIDGDTVAIGPETFRLSGIDAPELQGKCDRETTLAAQARTALLRWSHGTEARLTVEMRQTAIGLQPVADKFGRALARLALGGEDAAERLVRSGLVRAYDGGHREGWCE